MKTNNKLAREQLQKVLTEFQPLLAISIPPKGWIRAIRDVLGMSGRQLGGRMRVSKQRISAIEKQEVDSTVTLNTMRKIAESLECIFVYALVPGSSLDEILLDRAKQVASSRVAWASHTMELENQALSRNENGEILSNLVKSIMNELPSNLWDE